MTDRLRAPSLPWRLLLLALVVAHLPGPAEAQISAAPTVTVTSTPLPPSPSPTPVPTSLVASELEATSSELRQINNEWGVDSKTKPIEEDLQVVRKEVDTHVADISHMLGSGTSLESLGGQEDDCRTIRERLDRWNSSLVASINHVEKRAGELANQQANWEETRSRGKEAIPPETMSRISTVISDIKSTTSRLSSYRATFLRLQTAVLEQMTRLDSTLTSIDRSRQTIFARLFLRDSPPVWSITHESPQEDIRGAAENSFTTQVNLLRDYLERETGSFVLQLIVGAILVVFLRTVRRTVAEWGAADPSLISATAVFSAPYALAAFLTLCATGLFHPQAPRFVWAIVEALALIPITFVFRRTVERRLTPVLTGLLGFYFLDQVRLVVIGLPIAGRILFIGEMVVAAAFATWFIRSYRASLEGQAIHGRIGRAVIAASRFAAVILAVAVVANVCGFVALGNILGDTVLFAAYTAMTLATAVRVFDGLFFFALRVRPLSSLRSVSYSAPTMLSYAHVAFLWGAIFAWCSLLSDRLAIDQPLAKLMDRISALTFGVGTARVSLGSLVELGITIWGTFLLSRALRYVLEEEVYPRTKLDRGVPYAISTIIHYCILIIGFFLAIGALGVDMTRFTILAGAFGVGLGFGLQNIISNFVSGIIVLLERPVRVGDVVQLDDVEGIVERIGIRASFIRTIHGSEVIVPNAKLVSERVVNWTFSNRHRAIEIPVSVPVGCDVKRVMEILRNAAEQHPMVAKDPVPFVVATKFGTDSMSFELRAFTNRFLDWMNIRSELAMTIQAGLVEAQIPVR